MSHQTITRSPAPQPNPKYLSVPDQERADHEERGINSFETTSSYLDSEEFRKIKKTQRIWNAFFKLVAFLFLAWAVASAHGMIFSNTFSKMWAIQGGVSGVIGLVVFLWKERHSYQYGLD